MKTRVFMSAAAVLATSILFAQQAPPQRPLTVAGAGRKEFLTVEVRPEFKFFRRAMADYVTMLFK